MLLSTFIITVLTISLTVLSCTRAQNSSKEYTVHIDFYENNIDFDLSRITLYKADLSKNDKFSTVKFESLEGGGTYFIFIALDEFHGDKYGERLTIKCDENTRKNFSVNDILKWKVRKDEKRFIYSAPNFCD